MQAPSGTTATCRLSTATVFGVCISLQYKFIKADGFTQCSGPLVIYGPDSYDRHQFHLDTYEIVFEQIPSIHSDLCMMLMMVSTLCLININKGNVLIIYIYAETTVITLAD